MAKIVRKWIADGAINNAKIDASAAIAYSKLNIADSDLTIAKTSGLQTALDAKVDDTEKGANNGVATLDAGGKIPSSQLPNSVMEYKGTWAASTNTPSLADGTGNAGDVYIASDAGTVDFGAGNITFAQGDWVVYSGSVWEKSINSNAVASVNSQTGVVVIDADDISDTATTNKFATAAQLAKVDFISITQAVDLDTLETDSHTHSNKAILDATTASFLTADETKLDFISVTQAVDLDAIETASHSHANKALLDTYTQTEVNLADAVSKKHSHANSAVLDATTASFLIADETKLDFISVTQAVDLDTMESGISTNASDISDHISDSSAAHAGSAVSFSNTTSGLTATDVQAAIDEVEGRVDTLEGVSHTHSNKAILDATTASFLIADETKIDFISVTQAVDLDTMESGISTNASDISDLQGAVGASAEASINYSSNNYVTDGEDTVTAIGDLDAQVKANADAVAGAAAPAEEIITLDGTDISNGYVDLAVAAASSASIMVVPVDGPMQEKGVDYTVSLAGGAGGVTRITFAGDLASDLVATDKLIVRYSA